MKLKFVIAPDGEKFISVKDLMLYCYDNATIVKDAARANEYLWLAKLLKKTLGDSDGN